MIVPSSERGANGLKDSSKLHGSPREDRPLLSVLGEGTKAEAAVTHSKAKDPNFLPPVSSLGHCPRPMSHNPVYVVFPRPSRSF